MSLVYAYNCFLLKRDIHIHLFLSDMNSIYSFDGKFDSVGKLTTGALTWQHLSNLSKLLSCPSDRKNWFYANEATEKQVWL